MALRNPFCSKNRNYWRRTIQGAPIRNAPYKQRKAHFQNFGIKKIFKKLSQKKRVRILP